MIQTNDIYFSIVIPLYNKEKEIQRTIDSVFDQTWHKFEIIIVDDGSTDSSASIVMGYDDSRLRIITQANAGVSAARNRGIENSSYDYIAFLDADDVWQSNYLAIIHSLICRYPEAGAYATAYEIIDLNGKSQMPHFETIPPAPWEGLLPSYFGSAIEGEPVCSSAVVVPKSVLSDVGNFPTTTCMGEDKDMWERVALKYKIAYSRHAGAIYFFNSSNRISTTYFANLIVGHSDVYKAVVHRRPFFNTAQEEINQNNVGLDILPDLIEYLEKYKLTSAEIYIKFAGKPKLARNILKNTHPKLRTLQRKKFVLWLMSLVPTCMIRLAWDIKNKPIV